MDARIHQTPSHTTSRYKRVALLHAPRTPWGPFQQGQVKPLGSICTLGERPALLLERVGITDTRQLWAADAPYIASVAGVRPETADAWRCVAELLAIQGLQEHYAAPLVAAGVCSIEDLCSESPDFLLARLRRHEERHGDPSRRQEILFVDVQDCIDAAKRHMGWAHSSLARSATEA